MFRFVSSINDVHCCVFARVFIINPIKQRSVSCKIRAVKKMTRFGYFVGVVTSYG